MADSGFALCCWAYNWWMVKSTCLLLLPHWAYNWWMVK